VKRQYAISDQKNTKTGEPIGGRGRTAFWESDESGGAGHPIEDKPGEKSRGFFEKVT